MLEELDLKGLGKFTKDFAGFEIYRYYLERDWEYILGDERLFWRLRQNGRGFIQANPPGGTCWVRGDGKHDTPPWQVWVVPEDEPEAAFTNFRGHLPEDIIETDPPGRYTCRWQVGRASFSFERKGLLVETELGVVASMTAAVMKVKVRNLKSRRARLTLIPRIIPWLTAANPAAWEMPWLYQNTRFDRRTNSVLFEMRSPSGHPEQRRRLRWLLDHPFERLCLNEEVFIGRGDPWRPAALVGWREWEQAEDRFVYGYSLFAALARQIALPRDGEFAVTMVLAGGDESLPGMRALLAQSEVEFLEMHRRKTAAIAQYSIHTPDRAFNRYVNEYLGLQQQLVLYRGWPCNMMGTRDAAQDYTAVAAWYPQKVRRMILTILETERTDGWFVRQFSTEGRRGQHDERPCVDSGLWVWELVYEYVCQTRDFSVLDEKLPFLDSDEQTTVLDHLDRLLAYYRCPENLGEHGLCKIREGDWNDSVNRAGLQGRGETVMVSCHLIYCLRQAAQLSRYLQAVGRPGWPGADTFERFADEMRRRIRAAALNRRGFLNAVFSDTGQWFFSDADPDGYERFNMPANAFGIIAGVFEPAEVDRLCVYIRKLRRDYGYPLFWPPLGDPPVGGLGRIGSGDPLPGLGENGTCYNHGCHGFLARAMAAAGKGAMLYDVMLFMFPYDQLRHPVLQARTAPYAIVNLYKAAPGREGEGGDAFWSGSIPVAVRNIYQGLLGVQATPEGLRVVPCFPRSWKEIAGTLVYAGRPLHITAKRKGGGLEVTVNDRLIKEGWIAAEELLAGPALKMPYEPRIGG